MSLRIRLTLIFTLLTVGGSLIFGSLAYGLVSLTLISQVDTTLSEAALQLIPQLRVNSSNQFDVRALMRMQFSEELIFQVWGPDGVLVFSKPTDVREPLTGEVSSPSETSFRTYTTSRGSLRALVAPIETPRRSVGVLMVAQSLRLVETAQQRLMIIALVFAAVIAPLSGLAAWFVTKRAIKPLTDMTEIATQITRADDLHRRISIDGSPGDEVGQLMHAFNQTMERLENLFNSQNRFIADVSHELRTPLTVIKGNVGLMKRMGSGDEESLDSINAEVDRLTRLVGDLLLLAQAETGNLPLEMGMVELDSTLLEIYQQMKTLAGERVKLNIVEIDQIRVKGDPDRLKQVMLNLIANAIQHTPATGEVSLRVWKNGSEGGFEVRDTGPGIAEEDLPYIFDRFYRSEKSRKREKNTGFGLGLSIAKWIVNNHKGRIEVESQVGKGTTFRVYIPLWDDPTEWGQVD